MKPVLFLPALVLTLSLSAVAGEKVFDGSFEKVVCADSAALKVRASDLSSVAFTVPNYSAVKVFQGWGEHKRTKLIEGTKVQFIEVQFPEQGDKTGWLAESLVRAKSNCEGAKADAEPVSSSPLTDLASLKGLSDPSCCLFPVKDTPTADYNTNQRKFGANRSGGRRLHAACDLYRFKNEPILSVAQGEVLRDPYPFYQGTYALEVRHAGGFVVRYGEITPKRVSGVSSGAKVTPGQTVGYMGKVNSNCCEPMLHFELYSGAKTGNLNTGGNKFLRRSDLLNPTAYLRRWEENSLRHRR